MAISYNTGTTSIVNNSGTPGGHTFTIPAGVLSGDVILVLVMCFTTATGTITPTLSSSATAPVLIGSTQTTGANAGVIASSRIWSIVAGSSDPGATLTYGATGGSGGSYWFNVGLVSYTGASTSGVPDCNAGTEFFNASSTGTTTTPAATTVASGDWQVQLLGVAPPNPANFTVPGGLTGRQAITSSGNAGILLQIADSNGSVGGAGTSIGNTTWTCSGASPSNTWSTSFTVGLAPPASAAAAPYGAQRQAVRAAPPPGYLRSGEVSAELGPGTGNISGPVTGHGGGMGASGATVRNPTAGPLFRQAVQAVRARLPQQQFDPRGRSYGISAGGPVVNPPPVVTGPTFFPLRWPARIRPALPPRGRVAGRAGAPVRNPVAGPVFRQAPRPVQGRFPLPPRGRTASNAGGPVRNPVPVVTGPVFYPRNSAKAQLPLPRRGICRAIRFGPLPANPSQGPVFTQATSPARARFPLPPRGRVASNPGGPVRNPVIHAGPPFYPLRFPARIRITLPPRGRVSANPGAAVRNPHPGPAFVQAVRPIRAVIPQNAPRGRTGSNPGGPVANIPRANPLFRLGTPRFQWDTGTPEFQWALATPVTS